MATTILQQKTVPAGIGRDSAEDDTSTELRIKIQIAATADTPEQIIAALETQLGLVAGATRAGVPGELKSWRIEHGGEGAWVWLATLTYSTAPRDTSDPGGGGVGTFADLDISTWGLDRVVEFDTRPFNPTVGAGPAINPQNRVGMVNAADDRFSPLPLVTKTFPRITVFLTATTASMDPIEHIGKVNNAAWTFLGKTIPIFCARFSGYKPEKIAAGKYLLAYTFDLNFSTPPPECLPFGGAATTAPSGFIEWFVNAGFNEIVDNGGVKTKKAITLDGLNPVPSPMLLGVNGMRLNVDLFAKPGDNKYPPIYLDFMPHPLDDFDALFTAIGIPDTNPWAT